MSRRLSDGVRRVADATDPVAEVLEAHAAGDLVALRTSGSTGSARAVVRSTASWWDSFPHVTELLGLHRGSRLGLPGPLTATMNLFAAVHAHHVGADLVPGRLGATPVTHAVVTPSELARSIGRADAVRGVHVVVAGDRLDATLGERALAAGASAVSHYYGAAELSFVAWGRHADDLIPFPGVEVVCRQGEIWVRSPYLCLRYDGPDGPMRRDPDGYVTVGDRGRLEDDRLVVLGRGDDRVVTAGATVVTADVEAVLRGAGGVEVVVLGLPHPDLGQVLCGVVTDADALPALRRLADELLEPAARPRRWFLAPTLPLTDADKLDRPALADRLSTGEGVRRLP